MSPVSDALSGQQLPIGWSFQRLKHVATLRFSNVDKLSNEDEVPVFLCNYTDVYKNDFITPDLEFMQATATHAELARFQLQAGDVIITKDSETADDIAVPAYVAATMPGVLCGYHLAIVRPASDNTNGRFLFRALHATGIREQFWVAANGVTRFGLGQQAIGNAIIPVPPADTQSVIANFLDKKAAAIDALIAKKQRLIELLQEKRQALITQAVTKGLDRNLPMKDSGIEWLGKIPAHWAVLRLRHACSSIFLGLTSKVDYVDAGGIPLVRALNIAGGVLDLSDVRNISEDQHRYLTKYRRAKRNDVLLSKSGSIGTAAIVDTDAPFSIYESIFALRARPGVLVPRFLLATLRAQTTQAQYMAHLVGMGVTHLNMSDIIDVRIPVPPATEQADIAGFVDTASERLAGQEKRLQQSIEKLREYRQALISAAVTGKLDVTKERAA